MSIFAKMLTTTTTLSWVFAHLKAYARVRCLVLLLAFWNLLGGSAVGLGLLTHVVEPACVAQLLAQESHDLCALDGAQKDHGLCRGKGNQAELISGPRSHIFANRPGVCFDGKVASF